MTTPEDQKAEKCPFCGGSPEVEYPPHSGTVARAACDISHCPLWCISIPLAQWNTRPREKELEQELNDANKLNDTGKPLDEVMAEISDAVMDFQPDIDSASAGTLVERVETAAELARKAEEREKMLEAVLTRARDAFECREERSRTERTCRDDDKHKCPACHAVDAINAALEEKR